MNSSYFNSKIFILLFFLTLNINSLAYAEFNKDDLDKLSKTNIWKSLIHYKNNKPNINSKSFLLSYDDFSPLNELNLTIENFSEGKFICKYPARYAWLLKNLPNNSFKKPKCEEFDYYLDATAVKDIDLVFASENVSSPSSMMGHVFFKLSGEKNNLKLNNAVSFFTVIDTANIPLLILESTLIGMDGYFILNPYKKQIFQYLHNENRSVFEYRLKLTDFEKKLILYHFWELKDIDMKYFFTGFNCATMINNILSITRDNYKEDNLLWVTPKDVIKNANKNKLIKNFKMIPSLEWKLEMLNDEIDQERIDHLIKFRELKKIDLNNLDVIEKEFLKEYLKYEFINDKLTKEKFEEYQKTLNLYDNEEYILDLKDYKNPLNTINDSQVAISYDKNNSLELSFLPASNTIYDYNREYFSENSLKIGEINLQLKDDIELKSLNIYEMKLLLPWNNITKSISKEFRLSYEKHLDENLDEVNVLNVSGGPGFSYQLHNDIVIFSLINGGLGLNFKKVSPYISIENGFIVYELFNMKSYVSHKLIFNENNDSIFREKYFINQSIYLDKDIRIDIKYESNNNELKNKDENLKLVLNYIF